MRKIANLLALLVSLMLVASCFAAVPTVTDGLVGCWDFDEGSLVTAMDMSGNGNDGTMMNTTYANPPPGTLSTASLYFNNTQAGNAYSYVTIPDSPSLRPSSELTLAAWVKTNSSDQRMRHIISKQYGTYNHDSFVLWYWGNDIWFSLENVGYVHAAQPSLDEWHQITATYNGSFMQLYVDGVEMTNATATGLIPYDNNTVLIGADSNQASHTPDEGWDGFIDEVLIYNRSLSQAEITQIIPEFPSVLVLSPFMLATIIGVTVYAWRRRKQATLSSY